MTWVAQVFFLLGLFFGIIGNIGVLRFPDIYTRLHASSKCGTTTAVSVLVGCMIASGLTHMTAKILVITLFFVITSPVASHIIGGCAWQREILPWRRSRTPKEDE